MIKKKTLPKYGFGSTLQAVSPFLNLIPGVGQVASLAAGTIGGIINSEEQAKESAKNNIKYTPMDISTNPYGKMMAEGGNIEVGNSKQYNAPTHADGGQPINAEGNIDYDNPSAEIEGSENKYKYSKVDNKSYVFSDKNGTSELIRNIFNKYKNKKTDSDFTTKAAMEMEIKKVEGLNEKINKIRESQETQQEEPQMEGGGGLNVITMRKEQANQKRLFKLGDGGVPDGTPFQLGLNNPAFQGQPMYENPSPFKLRIQNQLPGIPSNNGATANRPDITSDILPEFKIPTRADSPFNFTMPKMNITNGNVADVLKGGLALYDVAKAANAKPEIVDPRLADYNKADNQLYSQNVDLTNAKNQAQAAANQGYSQVNDASMSNSTRMSRLQGVNSNLQANAGNLALQAQGMKNAISQNLGQYEGNKAVDNANRLSIADEKNAMNRAAVRSASESAKQTIGSYAMDFVQKQNQKDAWNQAIQGAKFKNADAMAALSTMANNFKLDGSKEYNDYVNNPTDENLAKLQKAAQIKFK